LTPDKPVFNNKKQPFNIMDNPGAIMVCALLVKHGKNTNDIINFYKKSTGNEYLVIFIIQINNLISILLFNIKIINSSYAE
jgi:hypothetical protein